MYLVFEIGGTNLKIGVSSNGEDIDTHKIVPTPQDFQAGMQTIKQLAGQLSGGQKIEAVAGGAAGPFDREKTALVASPHLPGWIQKLIKQELEKMFGASVFLDNETATAGLGEATKGAGAGKNIVAFITIGTGVGGVRIVNAKIDENSYGFEPGHQIIVIDGSPCNCGGSGHLESYVSGSGLRRIYGKKGEDIIDAKVWDEVAKYLAVGLNNTIVHWSPDIVVLGGSVMKSISLEAVNSYLEKFLTIFPIKPPIVAAKLGNLAGMQGALALIKQRTLNKGLTKVK